MDPRRRCLIWLGAIAIASATAAGAAEIKETDLPPPATGQIDFVRDIKPILEQNCLRCHGPEHPKSGFRLTDRANALKGGENGVDVIPGASVKSPLIHYVARLVPDMGMPPEGKGTPLTTNQVALLRAWIDQGVVWNDTSGAAQAAPNISVAPVASWTGVHGDQSRFRELEWQPEGWNGGAEHLEFSQVYPDGRAVYGEGHFLRDDYKLTLELRQPDQSFARFGFEQFRKYDDDAGGYYAGFAPPLNRLGDSLHLDVGRAWVELGVTLPEGPRIVTGYEYQYRDGTKSMLTWGPVYAGTDTTTIRNLYPSFQQIDEHTHVIRVDIAYDTHGFEFEDNLRAELHQADTRQFETLLAVATGTTPPTALQLQQADQYTQIANNVRVQKALFDWWLAGVGYRYSWLNGDASFGLAPADVANETTVGDLSAHSILLDEVWQIANASSQFRPAQQLTATVGVQGQWKRQETLGDLNLDVAVDPSDPTAGVVSYPGSERSTLDGRTAEENVLLRYTGLPFTSVFGEARLRQEDYTRSLDQEGTFHPVSFASDATVRWQDYLVGFNSSPLSKTSFGGHYRHRDRKTDYGAPVQTNQLDRAYPGFIRARNIVTDEVEVRLVVRPALWLKTSLIYRWNDTDFHTATAPFSSPDFPGDATPGGTVIAGRSDAHTVSANALLTPFRRLSFGATVSHQNSRTTTADNENASIVPYSGETWAVLGHATYALDRATDVFASANYSAARFAQHDLSAGLPLGVDYDRYGVQAGLTRRFGAHVSGRLQYGYFAYFEPSSGGLRDYTAHQILAVVNARF